VSSELILTGERTSGRSGLGATWRGGAWRGGARRRVAVLALSLLMVAGSLALAACAPGASPTPFSTAFPIGPTPYPGGTYGQYGLHIDPSLLAKLPATVDAYALQEDAANENEAMDNKDLAGNLDGYAAASIGQPGDPNWLTLVIGRVKSNITFSDFYQNWVSQYATGACSQADAVTSTGQSTIGGWVVDTAACGGGPKVYSLSLGNGLLLSMLGAGPADLETKLIESIYF
jgi:hypothetical protein